jgi:predicted  nucleic acid-binding Zn-ribbon protein
MQAEPSKVLFKSLSSECLDDLTKELAYLTKRRDGLQRDLDQVNKRIATLIQRIELPPLGLSNKQNQQNTES